MADPAILLTVDEAAALLRVSRDTVYRLVRERAIPSLNLGQRAVRIPRDALLAHIEQRAREAVTA